VARPDEPLGLGTETRRHVPAVVVVMVCENDKERCASLSGLVSLLLVQAAGQSELPAAQLSEVEPVGIEVREESVGKKTQQLIGIHRSPHALTKHSGRRG
jgi:hypothetical protein